MKTSKLNQIISLILISVSVLLLVGCSSSNTLDVETNLKGEWTYTNGLAEIEFDDNGNAAIILPSGTNTTETKQYTYVIEGDQITFIAKDTEETVFEANIELTEEDGEEYLTLSDLHDSDGATINPTTATFKKLSDSTEAIE